MWNDAFQTNCWNMQKSVVPAVPLVPPFGEPSPEPFLVEPKRKTTENRFGSTGSSMGKVEPVEPNHKTLLFNFGSTKNQAGGCSAGGGTAGTSGTAQKQHQQQIHRELTESALTQFQFDRVQAEIDAGYPADELHRVNNLAWHFMQTDGIGFDDAIQKAAIIVVSGQAAACEVAYIDVMDLFKRLTQ